MAVVVVVAVAVVVFVVVFASVGCGSGGKVASLISAASNINQSSEKKRHPTIRSESAAKQSQSQSQVITYFAVGDRRQHRRHRRRR